MLDFLASDQTSHFRDAVLGIRKTSNLVSFNLVEMFVINQVISTFRSSCFKC